MYIDNFVWFMSVVDKLNAKHHITQDEVEEVFFGRPQFRFVEAGLRRHEDVYAALVRPMQDATSSCSSSTNLEVQRSS